MYFLCRCHRQIDPFHDPDTCYKQISGHIYETYSEEYFLNYNQKIPFSDTFFLHFGDELGSHHRELDCLHNYANFVVIENVSNSLVFPGSILQSVFSKGISDRVEQLSIN